MSLPFFVSVPHSGERIAEETPWLNGLDETVLMCDPDRYVDQLYKPVIDELNARNSAAAAASKVHSPVLEEQQR